MKLAKDQQFMLLLAKEIVRTKDTRCHTLHLSLLSRHPRSVYNIPCGACPYKKTNGGSCMDNGTKIEYMRKYIISVSPVQLELNFEGE
jgi:hypothetical protein